jgi:hypothetical protein
MHKDLNPFFIQKDATVSADLDPVIAAFAAPQLFAA